MAFFFIIIKFISQETSSIVTHFILFYFILFYFILFYFLFFIFFWNGKREWFYSDEPGKLDPEESASLNKKYGYH